MPATQDADEIYQAQILTGVSRTFAVTIPQLPAPLYKVVSNGYLLCRIADTVEDEPNLTPAQKSAFSQAFIQVVAGEACPVAFSHALSPLLSASTSAAEKDLIMNTPRVIRLTHQFTYRQRAALHRCVRIMAEGMAEFQRYGTQVGGLKDMAEMNRYCYYVAGVVGEMLTALFCDYSAAIARHEAALYALAVSFGQGLQMTNILKDIWEDWRRGACWLPRDIFAQVGFDLRQLSSQHHDPAFGQGIAELISIARGHLYNALRYILLMPQSEQGIRRFCLYALGMAILTLRRINQRRNFTEGQQVKISRRQVKATMVVSHLASHHNASLRWLFAWLSRPLPPARTVLY